MNIYDKPILSCYHRNKLCFILLDTGATSSAISLEKAKELNLTIKATKNKLVQVDESYLEVCGEVHTNFFRENLEFKFSALVVKKMGFHIIGGTNFMKENDVYCRLTTNKIVVKGIHSFNSTPYIATLNRINTLDAEQAVSRNLLVKANKTETLLPGESQLIEIDESVFENETIVEIEPRNEAPNGFPIHHFQKIESNKMKIKNESSEPIKIKKNTPLCNLKSTVEINNIALEDGVEDGIPAFRPDPPDLTKVVMDPGNQFSHNTRVKLKEILRDHAIIFQNDLPGYNNHYGKVEAGFEWATKARPQPTKARQPDYNKAGMKLFNDKCKELIAKGVLKKAGEINIQPRLKNNAFLVKKQSATHKHWDNCSIKDVRLVTSFQVLQKFIVNIPAKVTNKENIHQRLANWNYMAEFDFTNMFYQLKLKKKEQKDKDKLSYLTIQSSHGTLVYVRGPQGLPGISEYQEELTDIVLGDMVVKGNAVKFADNVFIGGVSEDEFILNFQEICSRIKNANLRVGISKLIVGIVNTTILGWEWNRGSLQPSAHKLNPLTVCELPKTIKGLRSFLGAMRIHKKCLRGLDNISQPLDEACPSTKASSDTIDWNDDMIESFHQCQELLKRPESIVVPKTSDILVQVGDGCLKLPAVGTVLLVIRDGEEAPLPAGFFGFRLKQNVRNWSPCEIEAYTLAKGLEENSIYFRESEHPGIILSDNQNCVDCSKMLQKGLYSTSARLQSFITASQKFNVNWKHISGKLKTPLIEAADFASRNPVPCENPNCKICDFSKHPDESFATIGSLKTTLLSPIVESKDAWKQIQASCKDLRRAVSHLKGGTMPRKKERNINDIRLLLRKASLNKHGLLIVKTTLPYDTKPSELIVIPREYSESILTLLHYRDLDKEVGNHQNCRQLIEATKRKFYIFNIDKIAQKVINECKLCSSRKRLPNDKITFHTETKVNTPGIFYNADVLNIQKKKILVVRDNLTSFTQTRFIPD